MKEVHLFVEDKTQIKFLVDFIAERFKYQFDYHPNSRKGDPFYSQYGSWNEWTERREKFKENSHESRGITNLLFVDTDNDFKNRKAEIEYLNAQEKEPLKFELFLFPDHENTGSIETLLEKIYRPKEFVDCYNQLEKCVTEKKGIVPRAKTRIYTLAELVTSEKNRDADLHKDPARDYRNEYWDLNAAVLNSLYKFLQPYF